MRRNNRDLDSIISLVLVILLILSGIYYFSVDIKIGLLLLILGALSLCLVYLRDIEKKIDSKRVIIKFEVGEEDEKK